MYCIKCGAEVGPLDQFCCVCGEKRGDVAEQTGFTVTLTEIGRNKIGVIMLVREITPLGLREAKDLVEGAPKAVKKGVTKDEAAAIKKKFEEVGATVSIADASGTLADVKTGESRANAERAQASVKLTATKIAKRDEMKAMLVIEGKNKLTIELAYEELISIVSSLPDTSDLTAGYAILATHPSCSIRECVARKDKLDEATVEFLADDKEASVIRALASSEKARECLSIEKLVEMINRDVDTAQSIASSVESYANADAEDPASKVSEALANHPDPQVRNSLAGNSRTSKRILKDLLKDEDSRVRASAQQSLA